LKTFDYGRVIVFDGHVGPDGKLPADFAVVYDIWLPRRITEDEPVDATETGDGQIYIKMEKGSEEELHELDSE
jgi:hypothetical protein